MVYMRYKVHVMQFDILPPPNLAVMVGESLRPIVTNTTVTTFRQYTYADKYYTGGTLYTALSPSASANACWRILLLALISRSWCV